MRGSVAVILGVLAGLMPAGARAISSPRLVADLVTVLSPTQGSGDTVDGLEPWSPQPAADSPSLLEYLRLDRPGLTDVEPIGTVDSTFIFALQRAPWTERTLYRHQVGEDGVEPFLTVPVRRGRHGWSNGPPSLRLAGNAWFFFEDDLGGELTSLQVWRYDPESRDLRVLFEGDPQVTRIGASSDDLVPSGSDFLLLGSIANGLHPAIYRVRPLSGTTSKWMDLPAAWATSIGRSGGRWFLIEDQERIVAIDLETRTRTVLGEFPYAAIDQAVAMEQGALFKVDTSYPYSAGSFELWQAGTSDSELELIAAWPSVSSDCPRYLTLPPRGGATPALLAVQSGCAELSSELWVSDGSAERTRKLRDFPGAYLSLAPDSTSRHGELLFLATNADTFPQVVDTIWKTDGTAAGTVPVVTLPSVALDNSGRWNTGAWGEDAYYFPWEDSAHGVELWRTDGTACGTTLVEDLEPGPQSSYPLQLHTVGDQVIFGAETNAAGVELWQVDGGLVVPQPVADLHPGFESSAPQILAANDEAVFFLADDGVVGREIWESSRPSVARCLADATTLCLADSRFRARAVRRDFAGEMGAAGVVPLTGDSGYFWFFAPGNPEVLLKIVKACGLPGFENFWAYSTGLTNVEVELEIVDTLSGERKRVRTALGESYGPLFDSGSFQVCDFEGAAAPAAGNVAPQSVSSTVLPLLHGRFEARASWQKRDGTAGVANAVSFADDSGYFWFFAPETVEVLVKMIDACGDPAFHNFWLFAGGLTDVEVQLEVTDTWSGQVVGHGNVQGEAFPSLLETGRLRVCE